jgi:hypothetical protein
MADIVLNNQSTFVYVGVAIALAFLMFFAAAMWRQGSQIRQAVSIISYAIARSRGLPAVAPAPVTSGAPAAPLAATPLPARVKVARVERRVEGGTRGAEPAEGRTTAPDDADQDPYAALDALNGAENPLVLLRQVESELAALGALAEATQPGQGAEFLDVPGALGPTLSLAARRIRVAVDLLELAPNPPAAPPSSDPLPH